MKTTEIINFALTHKSVSINVNWAFEENEENGKLTFQNPMSGSYGTLDQAFFGWSEQDDELNTEWGELAEFADKFTNNSELYYMVNNGGSYELSEYIDCI
jgi:hypothetical protein